MTTIETLRAMDAPLQDVVSVLVSLASFGGAGTARRILPEWNNPRGTGLIANRVRWVNGRYTTTPSTASVASALRSAERKGLVCRCGTGEEHCNAWNKNAAQRREIYWRLSDSFLARAIAAEEAK